MSTLHFITGNAGKFAEVEAMLPGIRQIELDLPEIQSNDSREIIAAKLAAAAGKVPGAYIVEDTGLHIERLGGLPGPLIKWFEKSLGLSGIADLASRYENQRAEAVTWIGYVAGPGAEPQFFKGTIVGTIVAPRGEGFGWDVIFQPEGETRTFGEMSRPEKNAMSMRRKAIQALVESGAL